MRKRKVRFVISYDDDDLMFNSLMIKKQYVKSDITQICLNSADVVFSPLHFQATSIAINPILITISIVILTKAHSCPFLELFWTKNAHRSAAIIARLIIIKISKVLDNDCFVLYCVRYTYERSEYVEL